MPGVGKTRFAKALAKKLNATYVNLGEVALKNGFIKGFDAKRDTYIVDIKKLKSWLKSFLNYTNGLIVLNGNYAPFIAPKTQVKKIFILRCHPNVLKKRLAKRGYSKNKILENVQAELLDTSLFDALKIYKDSVNKICELNSTKNKTFELINEALKYLKKRKGIFGEINWINQLNKKGRLKHFL